MNKQENKAVLVDALFYISSKLNPTWRRICSRTVSEYFIFCMNCIRSLVVTNVWF